MISDWRTLPVAGIGILCVDHVAVTDRWQRDAKSTASHFFEQLGGPVPVALAAMMRLGLEAKPRLLSSVGDDIAGKAALQVLIDAGVSPFSVKIVEGARTARSLIVLDTSDGTRTLTNYPGEFDYAVKTPLEYRDIGLLHTDGRNVPVSLAIKRETDCLLSYDLGSMRPGREQLFPHCDIVIASQTGGAGAFPAAVDDPSEQVRRLLDAGPSIAGVTLGAKGVVIAARDENGGEPVHLPAFAVSDAVDTCGAGDLFHGAFLWAYRAGQGVFEAAMFAQAAVAVRIRRFGNAGGLPTVDEVESYRRSNLA